MAGNRSVHFTDEQMQEIERLALLNCNSNTIAEAVGVAVNTLKRHCGRKIRHWRAMYRTNLRQNQHTLSETSADMAKHLGKNVLGQVDKQVIMTETGVNKLTPDKEKAITPALKLYKSNRA